MSTNEDLANDLEKLLRGLEEEIFADMPDLEDFPLKEMDETVFSTNNHQIPLKYVKLSKNAVDPSYNYPTDSGFDLYSIQNVKITGNGRALIPTGLSFDIPEGYEIQVRSKSGLAVDKGLMVLNSPGTVDQGYNGEIKVIIFNTNPWTIEISEGQKIAQAVLSPVVSGKWINMIESDKINEKDRGSNGFGSTGI